MPYSRNLAFGNRSASYLFLLIVLICLSGCHNRYQNSGEPGKVFRYNESSGITSLDPAFAVNQANIWAVNQIFNGLVQLDNELNIQPCIAKTWDISNKGTRYLFFLRDDVYFHDDSIFKSSPERKVTAGDFEYSLKRILDPSTASPGAWVFNQVSFVDGSPAITALNDTTLEIILKQSFPPFLGLLTMQYCAVVPEKAIKIYGPEFRVNPVGTGPFMFKYWKEGVKLVLVKNPEYFETENMIRLPYIDAVAITFLIDKQSAFLEFVKGNLDFLSGIDPSYKDEILTKRGDLNPKYADKFTLMRQPYLNTEYLGILVDTSAQESSEPLRNVLVRKAINHGFDKERMIKYLRNDIGTPGLYSIIPPGMPGFDSSAMRGYEYDPQKAREYLLMAGFGEGVELPEIALTTTSEYLDLCKYIQHELRKIGIILSIDVVPAATLKELKAQSKLPFFRASWIADYPDAENYLSLFYSKNFTPEGPNYTRFSNKEFDSIFEESMYTNNDSVRWEHYKNLTNIIYNEAPVVVLYYDQVLRFTQNNISGLGSNPINLLSLKRVKIE